MSSRGLSFQTNYQAWRLAAVAILVCFVTSILVRNNVGAAISILAMTLVALVADRKLADLTGRSHEAIRALTDTRAQLENSRRTLEQDRATLETAINNMSQGLVLFDVAEQLMMCNRRYLEMYRLSPDIVTSGCTFRELTTHHKQSGALSGDVDGYLLDVRSRLRTGRESRSETQLPDGRWMQIVSRPLAEGGWVATHDDITEQRRSSARIAFLAHHDALTGLANRAAISQRIEEAAARERRTGEPFTVLLLDLDRFKQVNDTMGHAAGDALLCEVASRLKSTLRETDTLGRLGGDEFVVIQTRAVNPRQAATAFANRIVELLSRPFHLERSDVSIGVSIGIALAPEHASDPTSLLKMADLALYQAKSAGRGVYAFFSAEMTLAASERRELEMELRHAIDDHELELHYQPIVDAATMKVTAAEALLRWRHPLRGLLAPDKFLPIAEESGLIAQIGSWVLETACRQATTWPSHIKLAVNVSAVQLRKAGFDVVVNEALSGARLAPQRLELEISETALIKSMDCLPLLQKLKELGVSIVLDDFGTGQLTLSQLPMFPFDKIKIDSSFIGNMTEADYSAIIDATLTFAKRRRMTTTAEGVETRDQLGLLREAGVTSVQGYLFDRPALAGYFDLGADYGLLTTDEAAADVVAPEGHRAA
jgi:diguanylate cyclase (GGDEF)-like protein